MGHSIVGKGVNAPNIFSNFTHQRIIAVRELSAKKDGATKTSIRYFVVKMENKPTFTSAYKLLCCCREAARCIVSVSS